MPSARTLMLMPAIYLAVTAMFDGTISLGELIAIFITLFGTAYWACKGFAEAWRYREHRLHRFRLGFPTQWPVDPSADSLMDACKTMTVGVKDVLIGIQVGDDHPVDHFDIRLVRTEKGRDFDHPILTIEGMSDTIRGTDFILSQDMGVEGSYRMWAESNAAGGVEGHYEPARHVGAKRMLFLTLHVRATEPGIGWLSFRGADRKGVPVFERRSFCIQAANLGEITS